MSYLAAQAYPWMDMYRRKGEPLNLERALATVARAGFTGWEPIIEAHTDLDALAPLLDRHELAMRTIYMNLTLHDRDEAEREIARAVAAVGRARELGTEYAVVNPTPIDWREPIDKNDGQLRVQVEHLDRLGEQMKSLGVSLAYHTHASEMRAGAKELHHVLVNCDPALLSWCLDPDWIYRGTGSSALAVYDLARLYGERVTVLHMRQSTAGEWNQAVGDGDIDYRVLRDVLGAQGAAPLLVNEQIVGDPARGLDQAGANYEASLRAMTRWFEQSDASPG